MAISRERPPSDPDAVPRGLGISFALLFLSFYVEPWIIALVGACILGGAFGRHWCERRFDNDWRTPVGVLLFAALAVESAAFVSIAAIVWRPDDALSMMAALAVIYSALIHSILIRRSSVVRLVAVMGPQVLALLTIPVRFYLEGAGVSHVLLSLVAVVMSLTYFLHATRVYRRSFQTLKAVKRAAEAANAAKSEFVAAMSHEIHTPLNGVLGLTQMMRMKSLPPEIEDDMRALETSARGLRDIVSDILDMSCVEAGRVDMRPSRCNPRTETKDVVRLFRPLAAQKGLQLQVTVGAETPEAAVFDALRYRQCLTNLVSNAVKYTKFGGVTVAVSYQEHDGVLVASVIDTGAGIAVEELDQIFDRYHRVKAEAVSAYGAGLGLAITRKLAEMMGGRIEACSTLGAGATFTLTIPAPRSAPERAPLISGAEACTLGRGRAALIVDDNATNRMIARAFAERLGFLTEEAEDGRAAVEAVSRRAYDLILLDMRMPGMNGEAAFREIRASGAPGGRAPVIALTADFAANAATNYRQKGLDGFVRKPIDQAEFKQEIARVLAPPASCPIVAPHAVAASR